MQKVIKNVIYIILFLNLLACRHSLKPAEYVKYINDKENGLKKISQIEGWEYSFQYKPYDYIMLMENKGKLKGYDFEKRKTELKGTAWFNISIRRTDNSITPLRYGVSSLEEYNSRLNYYLNEAVKDIKLVYGKKTLQPVSYLFENNYNLSPQETMVIGFYLPEGDDFPEKEMRISLVDRTFKNGIINAEYSSDILKNIPELVY